MARGQQRGVECGTLLTSWKRKGWHPNITFNDLYPVIKSPSTKVNLLKIPPLLDMFKTRIKPSV
jgi:hypothetical protein